MLALIAATATVVLAPPAESRYRWQAPLPALPAVQLDSVGNNIGVAQNIAHNRALQGRVLWIDATANLERTNSEEKIAAIVAKAAEVGFNTLVYDVKPIVGWTVYPSRLAPQLTDFRGRRQPAGYDPVPIFIREARRRGLDLFVALNAFSEGHRIAVETGRDAQGQPIYGPAGPGYGWPERQSVVLRAEPVWRFRGRAWRIGPDIRHQPAPARDGEGGGYAIRTDGRLTFKRNGESLGQGELALLSGGGEARAALEDAALSGARLRFEAETRFVRAAEDQNQIPLMMNPHHPEVWAYSLAILRELLERYEVDGVLYDDRLRYAGFDADFSPEARAAFERHVGQSLRWPHDVYTPTFTLDLRRGVRPGRWYDAWVAWRAQTLSRWVGEAAALTRKLRPRALFGVYAGSWYGEYPKFGSNWASAEFEAGFSFLDRDFRRAGYAETLDLAILGAYYPSATIVEAMASGRPAGPTVESAGQLANRAVRDAAWTYTGIMLQDYRHDPRQLESALQAAVASSQGVMVFDLSHDIERYWPILARGFRQPAKPPHRFPALLRQVRETRRIKDRRGDPSPPTIIREGSAGAGH